MLLAKNALSIKDLSMMVSLVVQTSAKRMRNFRLMALANPIPISVPKDLSRKKVIVINAQSSQKLQKISLNALLLNVHPYKD